MVYACIPAPEVDISPVPGPGKLLNVILKRLISKQYSYIVTINFEYFSLIQCSDNSQRSSVRDARAFYE